MHTITDQPNNYNMHLTGLQITEHPKSNARIQYGERVTLSILAVGAENISYNWKKDGKDIISSNCIGFDSPNLTIINFVPDAQGKYSCIVKNCNSSIESEQADMTLGMYMTVYHVN